MLTDEELAVRVAKSRRMFEGNVIRNADGKGWMDQDRGWIEGRGMLYSGFSKKTMRKIAREAGGRVLAVYRRRWPAGLMRELLADRAELQGEIARLRAELAERGR